MVGNTSTLNVDISSESNRPPIDNLQPTPTILDKDHIDSLYKSINSKLHRANDSDPTKFLCDEDLTQWPFSSEAFKGDFYLLDRVDAKLPFEQSSLRSLGNPYAKQFDRKQYTLVPLFIEDKFDAQIEDWPKRRPWPFEEEPNQIGAGAYGKVFRAYVASHHLRTINESNDISSNDKKTAVVYKQVSDPTSYEIEVGNLSYLKKSLRGHQAISLHLAAGIQGSNFYIFLRYAELGDLETLLRSGQGLEPSTQSYDFDEKFPDYHPKHLFDQLAGLAGALDFLHDNLEVPTRPGTYCSHMDLKPNNVLVFPQPGQPVGAWKLSDFGISAFSSGRLGTRTIGDIASSGVSRQDRQGAHRAPELDAWYLQSFSGRASDVWSFGCIFCEVLAFAIGRTNGLQDFRVGRRHDRKDCFYTREKLSGSSKGGVDDNVLTTEDYRYITLPYVKKWLDDIAPTRLDQDFGAETYASIIKEILVTRPDSRPKAKAILTQLNKARKNISNPNAKDSPGATRRWKLELPKDKVIDWTLSPSGDSAAFLFRGRSTSHVAIFELQEKSPAVRPYLRSHLDRNLQKISIAGSYFAVHGPDSNGAKEVLK
ncbi:MAG: hypothetical protein Q9187_003921 [Circinaria calcarea]